jgi:hypothetical protein
MVAAMKTATELVDAFGGREAAAEFAGVGPTAVNNWMRIGVLPPRLYLRFRDAGRVRGIEVPVDLFQERGARERAA